MHFFCRNLDYLQLNRSFKEINHQGEFSYLHKAWFWILRVLNQSLWDSYTPNPIFVLLWVTFIAWNVFCEVPMRKLLLFFYEKSCYIYELYCSKNVCYWLLTVAFKNSCGHTVTLIYCWPRAKVGYPSRGAMRAPSRKLSWGRPWL